MTDPDRSSFWKSFGPGILFAGAAIGTSHLVQSTRAGATFGLGLLGIVVLANLVKYPAFRFGPQYAAATGRSLIEGYRQLGRWVVVLYLLSEVAVMAIIIAATAMVTSAIMLAIGGLDGEIRYVSVGLLALGAAVLATGGFELLDRLTKVFVAILTAATLCATVLSIPRIEWEFGQTFIPVDDPQTLAFVIALMGFMPSALDLSVLQSLWSVAKQRSSGVRPRLASALADFNIGYLGSAGLAICFVLMGAGVMHSAGVVPAAGAADFANQVIGLYTASLGGWAGTVVGIAALFGMFTTLLTILDGFPRLIASGIVAARSEAPDEAPDIDNSTLLRACTLLLILGSALVLLFLMGTFHAFIDFVTVTAFIASPITAILNHLVMFSPAVPRDFRPGMLLQAWSVVGVLVLSGLSVIFLYVRLS